MNALSLPSLHPGHYHLERIKMNARTPTASSAVDTSIGNLQIRRVAGTLGGEVQNIQLTPDLPEQTIADLTRALVTYKVLFFRGQGHLDDASHQAFGARLGKTVAHPTVPAPSGTKIFELDASKGGGRADSWHTDVTFLDAFPKYSVLRGVVIPPYGGDTVWADTTAAYRNLPPQLKALADSLWALHSNDYDYGAERTQVDSSRLDHQTKVFTSAIYETEHPIVHVHPVSGERGLLLGHFVRRILGVTGSESARIFELLQNRVTRLENTVRWSWQQDDVAIWDNRSTQHFAINDYGDLPRIVRRVTVHGDPAVSIDGQHSRTIRRPEASSQETLDRLITTTA